MSSKRPAGDNAEKPSEPKKLKLADILKPGIDVKSLTPETLLDGIADLDQQQLVWLRSNFLVPLQEKHIHAQQALCEAIWPQHAKLFQYRASGKQPVTIRRARNLADMFQFLARDPFLAANEALADVVSYHMVFCVSFAAFTVNGINIEKCLEHFANGRDTVEYFQQLVDGCRRHIAREQASSNTQMNMPEPRHTTTIPHPPFVAPPKPAPPAMFAKAPERNVVPRFDAASNEYLQDRVADYIMQKSEREGAVPWDDLPDTFTYVKQILKLDHDICVSPEFANKTATPNGVLLHGGQGTGKSDFVYSFCNKFNLKLYQVNSRIKGSLEGQTEKSIHYLFKAIREDAISHPVVLFLDEVDGFIGSKPGTNRNESLITCMKEAWGLVISQKSRVFIIGATNHPEIIDMNDFGRRFRECIHVTLPSAASRVQIFKSCMAGVQHSIQDADWKKLGEDTSGYSADDIRSAVEGKLSLLRREVITATGWTSTTINGEKGFVPKREGMISHHQGSCESVRQLGVRVFCRTMTASMLLDHFKHGRNGRGLRKTCLASTERSHSEWNARINGD